MSKYFERDSVDTLVWHYTAGRPNDVIGHPLVENRDEGVYVYCDLNEWFGVPKNMAIEKVIFNNPATIVIWTDGTKTVVKAENEVFDPEKGLAMAISKKSFGNKGNYFNVFKEWIPEVIGE